MLLHLSFITYICKLSFLLTLVLFRRWLISHGLRLTAMSTLEHPEVTTTFKKVVECAVEHGKSLAVDKLEEAKLLTVPLAEVPGYNADAYAELTAAMGELKQLELPHIGRLERARMSLLM